MFSKEIHIKQGQNLITNRVLGIMATKKNGSPFWKNLIKQLILEIQKHKYPFELSKWVCDICNGDMDGYSNLKKEVYFIIQNDFYFQLYHRYNSLKDKMSLIEKVYKSRTKSSDDWMTYVFLIRNLAENIFSNKKYNSTDLINMCMYNIEKLKEITGYKNGIEDKFKNDLRLKRILKKFNIQRNELLHRFKQIIITPNSIENEVKGMEGLIDSISTMIDIRKTTVKQLRMNDYLYSFMELEMILNSLREIEGDVRKISKRISELKENYYYEEIMHYANNYKKLDMGLKEIYRHKKIAIQQERKENIIINHYRKKPNSKKTFQEILSENKKITLKEFLIDILKVTSQAELSRMLYNNGVKVNGVVVKSELYRLGDGYKVTFGNSRFYTVGEVNQNGK